MIAARDLRVLGVLLRPSPTILLANAALIGWAGYLTVTAPEDFRGPYVVLLLCQAFTASTGYATRARRGHFDQLLAGRKTRLQFALAHALMSIVMGAVAWWIVSMLDAIGAGGHWPLGLAPRGIVAFLSISALAWAASAPFSRYTAGVAWLVVAIALAGSGRLMALRNTYAAAGDAAGGLWQTAGSALAFPPLMVGEPSDPSVSVMALVLLAAAVAVACGVAFVVCFGLPLEDAE